MITREDIGKLQVALAIADIDRGNIDLSSSRLIMRLDHVKVQMYAEKGPHKRPHFHVEFKREFRASYAIDTLECIVGYMPRRYEDRVLEWARSVQPQLSESWHHIIAGGEPLNLELERR